MKKHLIAISCLFLNGCGQKSDDGSHDSVKKDNLELRVIDFVLIDPATGMPPIGVGYEIRPPQGDYPSMGKLLDQDAEPYRFQYSWIAEKDEEPNIIVRVEGYEDTQIGLDKVKRISSHLLNTRIPLEKIILVPLKGEQAAPRNR